MDPPTCVDLPDVAEASHLAFARLQARPDLDIVTLGEGLEAAVCQELVDGGLQLDRVLVLQVAPQVRLSPLGDLKA